MKNKKNPDKSRKADAGEICLALIPQRRAVVVSREGEARLGRIGSDGGYDWGNAVLLAQTPSPITALAVSSDGSSVVVGTRDGRAHVLALNLNGHGLAPVEKWQAGVGVVQKVRAVAFASPDGQTVAAAVGSNVQWVQPSPAVVKPPASQISSAGAGNFRALTLSADGRWMAAGSEHANYVHVWDRQPTATGAIPEPRKRKFEGHAKMVTALAFAPRRKWLASGSDDGTVKLWNLTTGNLMRSFELGVAVRAVAFSPNEREIWAGSAEGKVRTWAAQTLWKRLEAPVLVSLLAAVTLGAAIALGWPWFLATDPDTPVGQVGNLPNTPATNEGVATNASATPNLNPTSNKPLTQSEIDDIRKRMVKESTWWTKFEIPRDGAGKFAYLDKMLASMRFFCMYGEFQFIKSAMEQRMQELRHNDVFLTLYGALLMNVPPPTGSAENRRLALQYLSEAVERDASLAHAQLLYGVAQMRELLLRGGELDKNDLQRALGPLAKACELKPDFADAHKAAADAWMRVDAEKAKVHILKALDLKSDDEEIWTVYLSVLFRQGLSRLKEALPLLEKYKAKPQLRFSVLGMLAESHESKGEFTKAYEYLKQAFDVIRTVEPNPLDPNQWINLYLKLGMLALRKTPTEFALGLAYLDQAHAHAKQFKRPTFMILMHYGMALSQMLALPTVEGVDLQDRMRKTLDLAFECQANEPLGDNERANLLGLITSILSKVDPSGFERRRLWQLTRWSFDNAQVMLAQGLRLLDALCPVQPRDGKDWLDPAKLGDVAESDLVTIIHVLVQMGLGSLEPHIKLYAGKLLGHLLAASSGKGEDKFLAAAKEILSQPATADQTKRKVTVCRVCQIYPSVGALAPLMLEALAGLVTRAEETKKSTGRDDIGDLSVYYAEMSAALKDMLKPAQEPPLPKGTVDEFRKALEWWRAVLGK